MEFEVVKVSGGERRKVKDTVVDEVPVTLHLNGGELATLFASPDHLKELSAGFLYSAGLLRRVCEIKKITVDGKNHAVFVEMAREVPDEDLIYKRVYTSGCGRGVHFYRASDLSSREKIENNLRIGAEKIGELMGLFEKKAVGFKETGGLHSAALSDGKEIVVFMEDIGRHNALDKAVGEALFRKLDFSRLVILTSGRVSSEIIFKVRRTDCPVLISRGPPTDQAVKIARECNLTLVGFARGGRMNVYAGEERIV